MPVKYWPDLKKQKNSSPTFQLFSSNKIEFMDLDNMERIDWKKPKWDRVTTQRQKRNLAKLLSNQTSRVLLVYLVFFVFTLVTLVEKSSQSVNRSDVAKSKSFQFSPIPKTRHEMERRNLDATCVSYLSKNRRKRHQQKSESQDFEVLSSRVGKKTCR